MACVVRVIRVAEEVSGHVTLKPYPKSKAGRRVEVSTGRGIVEVSEVTRTGVTVRTARFMASRVVALVEHPEGDMGGGQPPMLD